MYYRISITVEDYDLEVLDNIIDLLYKKYPGIKHNRSSAIRYLIENFEDKEREKKNE